MSNDKSGVGGSERVVVARAGAVASGHHASPSWANYEGEAHVGGRIWHAYVAVVAVATTDTRATGCCSSRSVRATGAGHSAVATAPLPQRRCHSPCSSRALLPLLQPLPLRQPLQ